jgi:putative CRISPR-associated protein (TIGR02619 family)
MRDILICTLGTSLLFGVGRSEEPEFESLRMAKNAKNWQQLALMLLELKNTDRICGAEINSITSILQEKLLDRQERIIFLVSDTDDGKYTGEVLKYYYQNKKNSLCFTNVEVRVLEGLRDDDVQKFQQQGLKNLVVEISKETRKFSAELIAINATGGYKAQISFAGMIGQALGIPVYYLFEKFSKVIQLPPQPVALDLSLWLENYSLFETLEEADTVEKSELIVENSTLASIETMLDEVIIDKVRYIALSAMGQLFHERCRSQFHQQETVLLSRVPEDITDPAKKHIHLRDDHGQDELEKFSKKICHSPYVKSIINSLPFNSQRKNCIRRTKTNGIVEFVLTWTDSGLGICIETTGRTLAETNTIALHLKQEYGK